jgi:1,4-alpha-glucan branching enzyme
MPIDDAPAAGELAIVLHTHMPYVEGYGTWPFGEEWLWEAIATSYLPLLDVLDSARPAPITLSLTPVLCDQLESAEAMERCLRFLRDVRPESHRLDIDGFRVSGDATNVAELERSAAQYATAAARLAELEARPGGLLAALGEHARWTSSASHAVLPLLCTEDGIDLQLRTGVESHRRRFGDWAGGLWLPECAHGPWLHPLLEDAGVRATCVELTERFGVGDPRHLHPLQTDEGPVLWPIDRATIAPVWDEGGYPSQPGYRSYNRLTDRHHRVWANDGSPYDRARASELVARHAREFVAHVIDRVVGGGVCVCALDTELLGHWWYEGVQWLSAVIDTAADAGLRLTTLDDALERHVAVPAPEDLAVSSWGEGGDLRTWSAPRVADLAWQARTAELRVFAGTGGRPSARALRELLALQASDWAFIAYRDWAGSYPRDRADGHAAALDRALAGDADLACAVRNLAPTLVTV